MKIFSAIRSLLLLFVFLSSTLSAVYDLSICAIFQNEGPWLKEWIEFHKIQGVKHFYLYNNNSQDDYFEVLEPYILNHEVTLIDWPYTYEKGDHGGWIAIQSGAYMNCIKKYGHRNEWIAFIDIDEFLYCPDGKKLPKFLKKYARFGGLCVNWIKFGTSDVEEIPPGKCMIEFLIHCSKVNDSENHFVKSIVQPKYVKSCHDAHYFKYIKGKYGVTANCQKHTGQQTESVHVNKIRINHYWTRTVKYFIAHKIAGRQHRRPQFTDEKIFEMSRRYNESFDTTILRYLDKLNRAMGFTH